MTLGEYLANPYGKGSNVAPTTMIRDNVERELREAYPEPIQHSVYKTKDAQLIIHCKLPSRTKKGVHYDVVIELDCTSLDDNSKVSIGRLPFKVFSNSPSFYYTYAKVFEERGLFCTWLKRKYERKIMRKDPNVRNPARIVGYERTVYTCMWYIFQKLRGVHASELLNRSLLTTYREIAANVQTQDEIETKYANAADTEAVRKKKAEAEAARKAKEEARKEKLAAQGKNPNAVKASPKSPTTQKTSKSPKTKKSSFISKIKKIGRK